jgi:hypothetical protein
MAIAATAYWGYLSIVKRIQPQVNWTPLTWLIVADLVCVYCSWAFVPADAPAKRKLSLWAGLGLLLGFVIAGAWSIGLFLLPSWLLLMSLAVIDYVRQSELDAILQRVIAFTARISIVVVVAIIQIIVRIAWGQIGAGVMPQFGQGSSGSGSVTTSP